MHRKLPIAQTFVFVFALFITASNLAFANFSGQPEQENHKITIAKKPTPNKTKLTAAPSPKLSITPTYVPRQISKAVLSQIPTQAPTQIPTTVPTVIQTSAPTPTAITAAPQGGADTSLLGEVNRYRQSQGLGSVQESGEVCAFAATRAQEISANFNHDGFNSRTSSRTLPYASWSSVTENIAMTPNPQNVVNMWINSPGHAENMRKDTPFVCIRQSGNYYAYEGMKP